MENNTRKNTNFFQRRHRKFFTVSPLNMFQIHQSPAGPNSPEFRFPDAWGENEYRLKDGVRGDEMKSKLQLQAGTQDDYSSYSPPLWKTSPSKADILPLLPLRHPSSHLSPLSMTQAIANGREEMMKMIRDLPESSYELSLKDIVDLRISQETKPEPSIDEEPGFGLNPQQRIPKKMMSKITRSESMDNSAFLVKTFFPSFSKSKRKLAPGNMSRIIPRSSSINSINKFRHEEEGEKHETRGCWPSLTRRKKNGCLF